MSFSAYPDQSSYEPKREIKKKCSEWNSDKELLIDEKDLTLTEDDKTKLKSELNKDNLSPEEIDNYNLKKRIDLLKNININNVKNKQIKEHLKTKVEYKTSIEDMETSQYFTFDSTEYNIKDFRTQCKPIQVLIIKIIRDISTNNQELKKKFVEVLINTELDFFKLCKVDFELDDNKMTSIKEKLLENLKSQYNEFKEEDLKVIFKNITNSDSINDTTISNLLSNLKSLTEINELVNENIKNINKLEIFDFYMQLKFFEKMYNLQDAGLLKTKLKSIKLARDNIEYIYQEEDINSILELLINKINTAKSVKSDDFDLDNLLIMNIKFTSIVEKLKDKSNKKGGGFRIKKDKLKKINSNMPKEYLKTLVEIIYNLRDDEVQNKDELKKRTEEIINSLIFDKKGQINKADRNLTISVGMQVASAAVAVVYHTVQVSAMVASLIAFTILTGGVFFLIGLGLILYLERTTRNKQHMEELIHYLDDPNNDESVNNFFTDAYNIIKKDSMNYNGFYFAGKRKSSKRIPKRNSNKKTRKVAKHKKRHSKNSVATQKRRNRRKISHRNKSKGGKYKKKRSKKNRK